MIFVDTGAWIALTDRADQYHAEAVRIYKALKQEHARLVTTDYVMDETATRLRYDAGHGTAVQFLEAIDRANKSGKEFKQIHVTPLQFQEALLMFRQ